MTHPLLDVAEIRVTPDTYLAAVGEVFAVFDERTQDSGNISYGVRIGDECFFVKTAGRPEAGEAYLSHAGRVALLENAVLVAEDCPAGIVPELLRVVLSPVGPMLVYAWAEGELLHRNALDRFRALPAGEIVAALDRLYALHEALAEGVGLRSTSTTAASSTILSGSTSASSISTRTTVDRSRTRWGGCSARAASWRRRSSGSGRRSTSGRRCSRWVARRRSSSRMARWSVGRSGGAMRCLGLWSALVRASRLSVTGRWRRSRLRGDGLVRSRTAGC